MATFLRTVARFLLSAIVPSAVSLLRKCLAFVVFGVVLFGLLYLLQVVPEKQVERASVRSAAVNPEAKTTPAEVAAMQNEMRKTFVQVVGGAFVLVGLYYTYRTFKVTEQGHVTDRYSKAIEQLGAVRTDSQPNIEVRLGGIFALERLALDSTRDQITIMEVLTAYVRHNTPAPTQEPSAEENEAAIAKGPATDIRAILTAIGRRRRQQVYRDRFRLDLSHSDLRGADISNLHLEHTHFDYSRLDGAKCDDAHLEGSSFRSASLRGTSFYRAHLQSAHFTDAILKGAVFYAARLEASSFLRAQAEGADFSDARLAAARFHTTNLEDAKFVDAFLKDARFQKVSGLNVNQFEDANNWEEARFDDQFMRDLREAKNIPM